MGQSLRNRPVDVGLARGRDLTARFGRELRDERVAQGVSQRLLARRAGISQARVSAIERGVRQLDVSLAARLAAGVGGELGMRLYPGVGIGLRDSGQLRTAQLIREAVPAGARVTLEAPIGVGHDLRAADMLIEGQREAVVIEVERALTDFQAQLRRAQLKRVALAERLARTVRLVIAVPDTPRNQRNVATYRDLIESALPVSSRRIWAALRSAEPVGGDGLLWVRERRLADGGRARAGMIRLANHQAP
jgi:transcriptional regulator with XRE-family HTH domain